MNQLLITKKRTIKDISLKQQYLEALKCEDLTTPRLILNQAREIIYCNCACLSRIGSLDRDNYSAIFERRNLLSLNSGLSLTCRYLVDEYFLIVELKQPIRNVPKFPERKYKHT